jgi:hypothetical protein
MRSRFVVIFLLLTSMAAGQTARYIPKKSELWYTFTACILLWQR